MGSEKQLGEALYWSLAFSGLSVSFTNGTTP